MKYILRHKNIDVALLEIDSVGFAIQKIELFDNDHFPYGVRKEPAALNEWWKNRIIPASRNDIKSILRERGLSVSELALKSFGLGLTDQYWIVPEDKAGESWDAVNFFDNEFAGGKSEAAILAAAGVLSPDLSTSGQLPKRWVIENGKRYLIKKSTGPAYNEAYSEKTGSIVCKYLGIEHADYEVIIENGIPSSKCACFIDSKTEMIPAFDIIRKSKRGNNTSFYEHCVQSFRDMGIADARRKIDEMLVLDYLIANTDRHYYNFGVIRDADTLEALSFAPVHDCGNSMWHNIGTKNISVHGDVASKPFHEKHSKQIKKVSDISWYDPEQMSRAIADIEKTLKENENNGPERIERIMRAVEARARTVSKIAGFS